ncbi:protein DDI1 homolog 1 [Pipistrellus kuhlii]|uniref:DNA damage inducible 1-like protein 1 n=1 Tax=Pipistrellus kuhlii TaxID=59472 RepID=A0A7J7WZT4_PIPKU|nr:protein DDI1 homolog 1 [Pipistrellus kuhlii]KAF6342726.1 DNA damage inducible 1-like protein 1 [Pipistrellus kuhlii]
MLVTVYCVRRDLSEATFSLQVSPEFDLHNFRLLCQLESGIPAEETQIIFMERILVDDHCSLGSYGLRDGDMVVLLQKDNVGRTASLPLVDFAAMATPGTSSARGQQQQHHHHHHHHHHQHPQKHPQHHQHQQQPPRTQSARQSGGLASGEIPSAHGVESPALIRSMLLSNPHDLSLLRERNPPLAEALLSGDLETFAQVLTQQRRERDLREREKLRLYSADPFDLEAQARIEEEIRQRNIEENMNIAMEEAPESFGQVAMLYINCRVNGHPMKAFVDSGAQMTIMSQACAERCNIIRLVDPRWAGIAKGVGTQRILGRVHLAQIQIEGDFLPCSFSILEEQPMDMLLGLDMLRRHQCSIDLKRNMLVIGTTGTQTPFLPEGELPACAKLVNSSGQDESSDKEGTNAIRHPVKGPGPKMH